MGPTINIGGTSYRIDEIVALLEDVIHSGEETDDQMDLYLDYKRYGVRAFKQPKHRQTLILLLEDGYYGNS